MKRLRLCELLRDLRECSQVVGVKENKAATLHRFCGTQSLDYSRDCDLRRLSHRIPEGAGRERGKRKGSETMLVGELNRFPMTMRNPFGLTLVAAAKHRPNSVDHILCGEFSVASDHGLAGR